MKRLLEDVSAFHRAGDIPIANRPIAPAPERVRLRAKLIDEECQEVLSAMFADWRRDREIDQSRVEVDMLGVADGLADLIYVVIGAALEFGIPLERVWEEVQDANMRKVAADGRIRRRSDGKLLKPDDWQPPDIKTAVFGGAGSDPE